MEELLEGEAVDAGERELDSAAANEVAVIVQVGVSRVSCYG